MICSARPGDGPSWAQCLREELGPILKLASGYAWVAGGACRSIVAKSLGRDEPIADYDVFFEDADGFMRTSGALCSASALQAQIVLEDVRLVRLKTVLGVFDLVYDVKAPTPEKCLSRFHFTAAAFAVDTHGTVHWHQAAPDHVAAKKLVLLNPHSAVSVLNAVQKYAARGYALDPEQLVGFVEWVRQESKEDIEESIAEFLKRGEDYGVAR